MSISDRISRLERVKSNGDPISLLSDEQLNALLLDNSESVAAALCPSTPDWLQESIAACRLRPTADVPAALRTAITAEAESGKYQSMTDADLLRGFETASRELLSLHRT